MEQVAQASPCPPQLRCPGGEHGALDRGLRAERRMPRPGHPREQGLVGVGARDQILPLLRPPPRILSSQTPPK